MVNTDYDKKKFVKDAYGNLTPVLSPKRILKKRKTKRASRRKVRKPQFAP